MSRYCQPRIDGAMSIPPRCRRATSGRTCSRRRSLATRDRPTVLQRDRARTDRRIVAAARFTRRRDTPARVVGAFRRAAVAKALKVFTAAAEAVHAAEAAYASAHAVVGIASRVAATSATGCEFGRSDLGLVLRRPLLAFYDALAENGSASELMAHVALGTLAQVLPTTIYTTVCSDCIRDESVRASPHPSEQDRYERFSLSARHAPMNRSRLWQRFPAMIPATRRN